MFSTFEPSESISIPRSLVSLCGVYLIYWGGSLWIDYRRACDKYRDLPGYRTWFNLGAGFIDIVHGIFGGDGQQGRMLQFIHKRKMYNISGCDVHSAISILPRTQVTLHVADAQVIKEMGANRVLFFKPVEQYKSLLLFGKNIVASEGSSWKKYRKLSAPAFSARNNRLVWEESINLMEDMFDAKSDWKGRDVVDIDNPLSFTLPLALSIISGAGFGQQIRFSTEGVKPAGHLMSFPNALRSVSENILLGVFVPSWVPSFTNNLKEVRIAFSELRQYMKEMIRERTMIGEKEERFDLFSGLLNSNEGRREEDNLDDSEIMGNVFIFLTAGHETAAHTLAYAFGFLALFPLEQDRLYNQIKEVCANGTPSYDDMGKLSLSLAVFYETLRMFPSVTSIPKKAAEDTTIVTSTSDGGTRTIPVPQGTKISIHPAGLHYNSRYWKDPFKFDPSRFLDPNWPRDAFIPFSIGHRSCIGKPFAETEAVAIITAMTLHYKVELQDSFIQSTSTMSVDERLEKLFYSRNRLTLTPTHIPLKFSRR